MKHIFHNPENKQVNVLDDRFYTINNEDFYPSVTTVLGVYPKGYGFDKWLKENGEQADEILKEAGDSGSKVHDAIDRIIKGQEVTWVHKFVDTFHLQSVESLEKFVEDDKNGMADKYMREVPYFSLIEWQMVLKFVDFVNSVNPVFVANEFNIISVEMRLGGTLDIVCEILDPNDKKWYRWLIDAKTSNYIHKTHELQIATYAVMFNEKYPDIPIDKTGILWLKAQTKGPDKTGKKIQGAGWQLKEFERPYLDAYKIFKHVRVIFDEENPNYKPKNLIYPDRIKIEVKKQSLEPFAV